ncbi:GH13649 [Drosophila grimshawi]|uniref:GH13649 n=2 Tax=Drosophila grimshawi TaxID=7222 RepID=B4JQ76_DROGR|nr:GH13649 [Drosophila grimshawi]
MATSKVIPTKLLHAPKTLSAVGIKSTPIATTTITTGTTVTGTVVGTYRPMHIPSGITVTKHNNSNGNLNNNNDNNNNNNNNNNILKSKPIKVASVGQNVTMWPKATTTTLATITSVPSPQMLTSKVGNQKPTANQHQQQQKLPAKQKQTQQKVAILQQQKPAMLQEQQKTTAMLQLQQLEQKAINSVSTVHKTTAMLQLQQLEQKAITSISTVQKTTAMLQLHELQQAKQKTTTATLQQQQHKTQPLQKQLQQQQQKPPTSTLVNAKPMLMQQQMQQQKTQTIIQKLPVKQKTPQMPQRLLPTLQKMTTLQPKSSVTGGQKFPPPAHSAPNTHTLHKQKQQQLPPPPAHHSMSSGAGQQPPLLAKLTPMPMLSKQQQPAQPAVLVSAARHLPYEMKAATNTAATTATAIAKRSVQHSSTAAITTPLQSITAGATPPLRLLATPPHCAAALNEPLLLNLPPTTSITPQLTPTTTPPPAAAAATPSVAAVKMSFPGASISPVNKPLAKRVQPITVLKKSDEEWRRHLAQQQQQQQQQKQQQQQLQQQKPKEQPTIVLVESPPTTPPTEKLESEQAKKKVASETIAATAEAATTTTTVAPLVTEYAALLQLCRELDKSKDMERLIEIKLMKYYYSVHESFVRSRGFRKQLEQTMVRMRNEPDMIYVHLKGVVEELKVRRKAKAVQLPDAEQQPQQEPPAVTVKQDQEQEQKPNLKQEKDHNETVEIAAAAAPAVTASSQPTTTGNKRTDERIRKLNRTLYTITKRIAVLEEAAVDWNDDDDSSYLQVERYKKRACQIYEKICDLTGESKSAHRQMKQPILFKDTAYPQFNRTLSAFVNRMHEFPDYHDVLQLLEHCNKDKNLGLATFEMKRIAHDAFVKVGRLLQARRRTDLYETVTHFTANSKDPAASDSSLLAKLNDNNKKQTKISDILEKFAREQDLTTEEQREARLKEKLQQQQQQQVAAAESSAETAAAATDETTDAFDDDKPCTSAQAAQAVAQEQAQTAVDTVMTNGLKIEIEKRDLDSEMEGDSDDDEDEDDDDDDEESDEDVDAFVDSFKANGDLSDAESETEANAAAPKTPATDAAAPVIVNNVTRVKTAAAAPKSNKDDVHLENATVAGKVLFNGSLKDAPAAHILKVMSVSSLNATINHPSNSNGKQSSPAEQQQQQQQKKQQRQQILIDTEIVISDEES